MTYLFIGTLYVNRTVTQSDLCEFLFIGTLYVNSTVTQSDLCEFLFIGTLYVNSTVTLAYRVTNVGGGSTRVVVKISDDKGFSQVPVSHTHTLSTHQNITGTFSIKAGQAKGETV